MSTKTTFLERNDFQKKFTKLIDDFEEIYSKSNFILNEELYPIERGSYHFLGQILKKIKKRNRSEQALASQLFNSVYRSEVTSAGAGQIAFLYAIELARQLNREQISSCNEIKILKEFTNYMERFKDKATFNISMPNKENIKTTIKQICNNDILVEVIWEALNLAGLEGKIFIENGRQKNYIVELKEGYTFNLNPYSWMLEKGPWIRDECKVLVVDGLVEKVSEIDQILQKAFQTKQPLIIVARGFSEEVGMTLRTNFERGLLDVQPIRIPVDLESINIISDLCVVCGTTPISSFKGDLIAFAKWDEIPTVEKIRLSLQQTVVENSKTRTGVSSQIKALLEKRYENNLYEDVQILIDKRMKSLVSNTVNIMLPEMSKIENEAIRVQIDICLRQIKTILNYGTTDFYKSIKETTPETKIEEIFYKALKGVKLDNTITPTLSVIMGCMLAGKAMLQLYIASGFVAIDE